MFESLTIEGYRCFERFEIPELRRVNLLVGRNNAGKSTVLEAVGLLVSGGDLHQLRVVAPGRGEARPQDDGTCEVTIENLFFGRRIEIGRRIRIASNVSGQSMEVRLEPVPPKRTSASEDYGPTPKDLAPSRLQLTRLGGSPIASSRKIRGVTVKLEADNEPYLRWAAGMHGFEGFAYVPPTRESVQTLQDTWNALVGNPQEDVVVDVLRVVEPGLERIIFAGTPEPQVYARFRDSTQRVPFGSLGEGAWRLLQIGLYLAWSKSHLLLLDEVDTGLHWSAMVPVWKMILTLAKQSNVQVFATTHSDDCIRALAELHEQDPEVTQDFMLHYISRDESHARSFTAAEVATAVEHKVELRG